MFEKVNPAHPDKVADRIAGALVDLAYQKENNPKIAIEVLIGHGICHIISETSVTLSPDEVAAAVSRIAGNLLVDYCQDRLVDRRAQKALGRTAQAQGYQSEPEYLLRVHRIHQVRLLRCQLPLPIRKA